MRKHSMMDRMMRSDYGHRMPEMDYVMDRRGRYRRQDYGMEKMPDYAYDRTREYMGSYGSVPFYIRGSESYDYGDRLSKDELYRWIDKLLSTMQVDEKEMFKIDRIIKRASELGIKFDKFTEDELYVTVLMLFTDYKATLGKGSVDTYIKMAKDFLCDEDAGVRYADKLASYYDFIVEG